MARAAENRPDRRRMIAKALYTCISKKGYANTSLKDIAQAANMSPSHLGYYFDNKSAILESYAQGICEQNLADLPDLNRTDPNQLPEALADFCLGPGRTSTGLLSVIQEVTGLAAHDERLHDIKSQHSSAWRKYLEKLFTLVPLRAGLSSQEAAWQAHALIVGMNTNLLFDAQLDRPSARRVLTRALQALTEYGENPTLTQTRGQR